MVYENLANIVKIQSEKLIIIERNEKASVRVVGLNDIRYEDVLVQRS